MSVRPKHIPRFCVGRRSITPALLLIVAALAAGCDSSPPTDTASITQPSIAAKTPKAHPTEPIYQKPDPQYINYRYRDWQIAYPVGWTVRKAHSGIGAEFDSPKDLPAGMEVYEFDPGKTLAHADLLKSARKWLREELSGFSGYKEMGVTEEDGLERINFVCTDFAVDDGTGRAYLFPHGRGYLIVMMVGPTNGMSIYDPIFQHSKQSFIQIPKASK